MQKQTKLKFKVIAQFDEKPINGKRCDYVEMKLTIKAVNIEKAKEIARTEAKKTWPKFKLTIYEL